MSLPFHLTQGYFYAGLACVSVNHNLFSFFKNDRIYTGLTVVEYLLADEGPGDGGVAVIPGSHKANLPCPKSVRNWDAHQQYVTEILAKAGDAVIFTETLTHVTLPWNGEHQRRALLYKYSPGYSTWGKAENLDQYLDMAANDLQRDLLRPPYVGSRTPLNFPEV